MKLLPSGHCLQVHKVGSHSHPAHARFTLHRVHFWASEEDFKADKPPLQVHDFVTGWIGPHPDPESRMTSILEHHVAIADRHQWRDHGRISDDQWSKLPDTHGNLAHPSMVPFREAV